MPTKKPTKPTTARRLTAQEQAREDARRALRAAVKREKEISRLTKTLERVSVSANDALIRLVRGIAIENGFELVAVESKTGTQG